MRVQNKRIKTSVVVAASLLLASVIIFIALILPTLKAIAIGYCILTGIVSFCWLGLIADWENKSGPYDDDDL